MSKAPFWPVATDAMIADTTHLTAEETGAYMMLLMCLWRSNGKPLNLDHKRLSRMARVRPNRWPSVWENIEEFFDIEDATITQKRLRKDWVTVAKKIDRNRESGSLGGKAKSLKTKKPPLANANDPLEQPVYQPEPEPKEDKSNTKVLPKKPRKSDDRKCKLETVIEANEPMPTEYREYADKWQLEDAERTFTDWAEWWIGEAGRKAGARGWLLTWQGRVRKDIKRQKSGGNNSNGSVWHSGGSTIGGAGLAIHRRRERQSNL